MSWIEWTWLILTFVCIILELLTAGIFFILFAVGTLLAFVVAFFSVSVIDQVVVFAAATLLCLLFLRPFVRRWLHLGRYGKDYTVPDYIEQNIGREAPITRAIPENGTGQVRIGTEVWTARELHHRAVAVGTTVRVVRIEGVTAIVEIVAP
ncbi:NfeD family protein [Alicyclobacillus fastidiosus]|uniref:NfeD family protein n=1 Tax=Alicyclobacillus fastidiosus TaxID=392011 RepID=A0ABV5ABI6_9BACL|nr:NfeD family protein [Alicyclobacillus fastidiosus]WEH10411.1 NfeD family protein [Alicyclobacillus fastidiosus]